MPWWDFYRLWTYSFEKGPLEKKTAQRRQQTGAGVIDPTAIPDLRGEAWGGGSQGFVRLHASNDFVDLSTVTNRQSRYKEYERLRNVAEIEMAMTVIADESCVIGPTKIATLADGFKSIGSLASRWKKDQTPFLVYCWDFEKNDYSLDWAYDVRSVGTKPTIKLVLDDASTLIITEDHLVLTKAGEWKCAGDLEYGSELMPFYRLPPNPEYNSMYVNQFPRVYTSQGWMNERQFINRWKYGFSEAEEQIVELLRLVAAGFTGKKIGDQLGIKDQVVWTRTKAAGFTAVELAWLYKKRPCRKVIGKLKEGSHEVYDLSVKNHQNFCTDSVVLHNCQRGEDGHVFHLHCESEAVKEELNWLLHNRRMLNLDRKIWQMVKRLCIFGDGFYELIIDPEAPKDGILGLQELPPDSIYKIVTTKGKLVEYQQGKEGPDYQALTRNEVTKATESELQQSTATRFAPNQLIHFMLGDDRKTFYPYGQSLIEPARGPAHQLRLMEDSMVVYRLCLAGDTRVRTKNGWKYIKDLQEGDEVFSYSISRRKIIPSKVLLWKNNGKQQTYKVRSKHIEITGNATHPIWVERDGVCQYVLIKDLIPKKDKLPNVTRDDNVLKKIPKVKGLHLPEIVTEEFARLFGFLNIGSVGKDRVGFSVRKDDGLNQYYAFLLERFFGKVLFDGGFVVKSAAACSVLKEMGYGKRIPDWVFTAPVSIRRAFVEGLSDAFGHKHADGSTIELYSKHFIADIKEIWASIGLCSGKIEEINNSLFSYALTISDQKLPEKENVWSVTKDKVQDVFDITVDNGEHNFIANCTIVHNTRAPERRIFYIDVGQLPSFKAEAFIERMKDQFRKKKVATSKGIGLNTVEERWHPPSADEDYWMPIRQNSNSRIETLPGACLALDTEIPLLDGTNNTLAKVIERWNEGEEMWAYSCDPKTGRMVPGLITWAGVTRRNAKVMKVTFDNGKSLICTSDHKFPVNGKEGKIEARNLEVGDSLIPFRMRQKPIWGGNKTTYNQIYDPALKKWVFVHRTVAEYLRDTKFNDRSDQSANKHKIYGKSTLNFPKNIFTYFMHRLADGVHNVDIILDEIRSNDDLMQEWKSANKHVNRKGIDLEQGIKRTHVRRMVESYGYKSLDHARQEASLYNHTVISIEYLEETQDVGTITIDGTEKFHDYHTFAISCCGIMTYNSNLSEIDDALYFRNKLFTALNFPRNYFNNEDPNQTRITLSAQDVKFARMIERIQSHVIDGILEICERHLELLGYPQEAYEDLQIDMTPPSSWKELSDAEVWTNRINLITSLKGSMMMADFDLFTRFMNISEDEATKLVSRNEIQKLKELKLQIIGQNPQLLGLGIPGQPSGETELGAQIGGPNPMLGPPGGGPSGMGGMPPAPGGPNPMRTDDQMEEEPTIGPEAQGKPGGGGAMPLPEPTKEDIKLYNLEIEDYSKDQDAEDIDYSEES